MKVLDDTRRKKNKKLLFCFVFIIFITIVGCFAVKKLSADIQRPKAAAGKLTMFLSGDALISLPWSDHKEPRFLGLIDEIRNADVAITNLEMLLHDYEGFPQAGSGGTYMRADKKIAKELAWAGIDMVSNANNHTFDYGSVAVLKTIKHCEDAGLKIAGSGKDLQQARSAVYYEIPAGKIALLAVSSTFPDFGKASRSRPDLHGRPGLNPLSVNRRGMWRRFKLLNYAVTIHVEKSYSYWMDPDDLEGNLQAVRQAAKKADIVVMSVHSHQSSGSRLPADFYIDFAHKCIDNGADVVFGHGHHYIKGVEIYKGKPIFYSLGNFVFQNESITKQPWEFYSLYGLDDNANVHDAYDARTTTDKGLDTKSYPANRQNWESIVAILEFENKKPDTIKLLPITLMWKEKRGVRGRPLLADRDLGKYVINQMIERSEPFGTGIEYDKDKNIGIIKIK